MSSPANPDLIKVTEIFLVPSSFLVAALGTADTNPHRAGVSVIGLIVSLLWAISSREALAEQRAAAVADVEGLRATHRIRIMSWLPVFFLVCWLLSVIAHVLLWRQPLGH